jgi:hypothetical protein
VVAVAALNKRRETVFGSIERCKSAELGRKPLSEPLFSVFFASPAAQNIHRSLSVLDLNSGHKYPE